MTLERKTFYCGTKPDGTKIIKRGWVAHVDGKTIGDETVDRGLHGNVRWEPRYLRAADLRDVLAELQRLTLVESTGQQMLREFRQLLAD